MSQEKTLELLRGFGRPARPIEIARLGEQKGIYDGEADNNEGKVSRDLRNLKRWGLVRERRTGRVALYWVVKQ